MNTKYECPICKQEMYCYYIGDAIYKVICPKCNREAFLFGENNYSNPISTT
jgi:ribosomal protein L37AE/L43A